MYIQWNIIQPFKIFFYSFILGCVGSSLMSADFSCRERGLLFVAVRGLLIAVASLVVEHGLYSAGSVVVVQSLSCSAACAIFSDQGSNPCPLHWQADS